MFINNPSFDFVFVSIFTYSALVFTPWKCIFPSNFESKYIVENYIEMNSYIINVTIAR